MIEKTMPFMLNNPRANLVKGHTRIELTKVATGEKKIIEHYNTFQSSVLASYLRGMGVTNNSPFANATWKSRPVWRNMCGGIFLFRDEILAPAEYMPAGNLMVANGSFGVVNASNPTELGSYNFVESSTSGTNSLAFVYDWGTSQGNGTISCVCLTSEVGGYIGYGNASGNSASLRWMFENQNTAANGAVFFYGGKKYSVSAIDLTNKNVKIVESVDQITKVSIFQGQDGVESTYTYTGNIAASNNSSQIMTRRLSETEFAIVLCDQFVTLNIDNGSTARILVFDVSTKTLRAQSIANTSGGQLKLTYSSTNNCINLICDSSGNYYMSKDDGDLVKFNSAGVYQETITANSSIIAPKGILTPDLMYMQEGYSSNDSAIYVYDGTDIRITNGFIMQNMGAQVDYLEGIDAFGYASRGNTDLSVYKNPLYLATINNLEAPVTKDSTQTMKVIYTLTEAS